MRVKQFVRLSHLLNCAFARLLRYGMIGTITYARFQSIVMTRLTLEHVSKRYTQSDGTTGVVNAVDDISLNMPTGEVLAILGPSGCGKSTLLRIIAGLIQPDTGRVLYDNTPLKDIAIDERGIGMVFQEGALIPHWKAEQSVSFFFRLRHREREVPEKVKQVAKVTGIGLEELLAKRPRQLSGGEKQRVSIARALTRDLRILLFDEPFANIDSKLRTEARVELNRLLNEFPVTSIYVTHDQVEAISLSKRIAVMREGRFVQVGTYQQLHETPVNMFVATFVGTPTINLFDGYVESDRWYGDNFGGFPIRPGLSDGSRVTLGVRPENVHLVEGGIAGVVDQVTPYLAERYQLLEVWLGRERWQLTVPLNAQVEWGSTIYCGIDLDYVHYFDTETGTRIG